MTTVRNGIINVKSEKKYMNDSFWENSWLLEFNENGVTKDVFTFSVSPQSEEFTFPQRINETKTFGGSVVDDYGNDSVKISFSGSTLNQEVKRIYRGNLNEVTKNGEQEIFYLRDLMKEWGKQEKLRGKTVYLYHLGGSKQGHVQKWWLVYPQDLKISRSKDQPLAYNYSISFLAAPEGEKRFNYETKTDNYTDTIKLIADINAWCENVAKYTDTLANAATYIENIRNHVAKVSDLVDAFYNMTNGYFNSTMQIIEDSIGLSKDSYKLIKRGTMGLASALWSEITQLAGAVIEATNYLINLPILATNDFLLMCQEFNMTTEELEDTWKTFVYDLVNYSNNMQATVKKYFKNENYTIDPGTQNGNADDIPEGSDSVKTVYGTLSVKAKDSDTWDSLANQFYGNADLAALLAYYNSSSNDNDLKAGKNIYIPILSKTESVSANNEVYNLPDIKDNYGSDFALTSSGDFDLSFGDINFVNGTQNLTQAIGNRLSTTMGARIRDVVYGIRSNVGSANSASNVFIVSSVEQTLLADPRVKSIESIEYKGDGDKLNLNIVYTDINNERQKFGGTI